VGQDHGGLPFVRRCGSVGSVNLDQIVAAALEAVNLFVGHALRQQRQFGVLAEEVFTVEAAVVVGKGLDLELQFLF
jgi:hypothetical protein